MSKFDQEQFMADPDLNILFKLRLDEHIALGKHLSLEVRSTLKVEDEVEQTFSERRHSSQASPFLCRIFVRWVGAL